MQEHAKPNGSAPTSTQCTWGIAALQPMLAACILCNKRPLIQTWTDDQVANLGKSGVSVGYYDTEEAAAKAYDRAAIGLLGRDNCSITTNFPLTAYDEDLVSIVCSHPVVSHCLTSPV